MARRFGRRTDACPILKEVLKVGAIADALADVSVKEVATKADMSWQKISRLRAAEVAGETIEPEVAETIVAAVERIAKLSIALKSRTQDSQRWQARAESAERERDEARAEMAELRALTERHLRATDELVATLTKRAEHARQLFPEGDEQ